MNRLPDRRIVTLFAAAVFAAIGGPSAAPADEIGGAVRFEGGALIPEGHLEIRLDDPAGRDDPRRSLARTGVKSDGKSTTIAFSLALPGTSAQLRSLRIVARLERADGWLLARGSAKVAAGSSADITLSRAVY